MIIDGFALVAATEKTEKAKNFGDFADCFKGPALRKVLDIRGLTRYSIVMEQTPSKQRQELDVPRTRRGLCTE